MDGTKQLNIHLHEDIVLYERKERIFLLLCHVTSVTAVYLSSIIEHERQWGMQNSKELFLKIHVKWVTGVFNRS